MHEESLEEALHPEPDLSVSLFSRAVKKNGMRPALPLVPTAVYPVVLRMIHAGMTDHEIAPLLGYTLQAWTIRKRNLQEAFPEDFPDQSDMILQYFEIARWTSE